MSTPKFKLINPQGDYVAAFRHVEDAACLLGLYGDGAVLRAYSTKGVIVWREGKEHVSAAESYDAVAQTVAARIKAYWADWDDKRGRRSEP